MVQIIIPTTFMNVEDLAARWQCSIHKIQALAEEKQITVGTGGPAFTLRDTYTNAERTRAAAKAKLRETTNGTHTLSLDIVIAL